MACVYLVDGLSGQRKSPFVHIVRNLLLPSLQSRICQWVPGIYPVSIEWVFNPWCVSLCVWPSQSASHLAMLIPPLIRFMGAVALSHTSLIWISCRRRLTIEPTCSGIFFTLQVNALLPHTHVYFRRSMAVPVATRLSSAVVNAEMNRVLSAFRLHLTDAEQFNMISYVNSMCTFLCRL